MDIKSLVENSLFNESDADDLISILSGWANGRDHFAEKMGLDINSAEKLSDSEVEKIKNDLYDDKKR